MKKESVLRTKSYTFAVRVVKLCQYLQTEKKEYILSKQIIRSGTSIGALIYEAEYAQSNADFIHKFSISLKEANETIYWLSLLKDTSYLDVNLFNSFYKDCDEIICLLVSTIKTLKLKNP
ncbi:MAG: four helix bundle protein [Prevotellaceae bacterium]|jgi:four helix bundle protein|nr:four helix bundle protein [Prevotellaceae bacterium]